MGGFSAEAPPSRVPRLTFVMEHVLGHQTYAENLETVVRGRDDIDVKFIAITYEPTDRWWERIPIHPLRAALRCRREIRLAGGLGDADVVVVNTQVPAVLAHRSIGRRPYVICSDDTPVLLDSMAVGYGHRLDRSRLVRWAKHRWNTRVFRRAAAFAPWSEWVAASLVADYGVAPSTIEVIPPGVLLDRWTPAIGSDDGPMRILFVGGDFERKGGRLVLDAFSRLPAGCAELHIVTRDHVPSQPGVEVHRGLGPNDPALRRLFESSDVFVLPSRWEMFGIAALEAAAAGLPVIASAVGGLRDLVIDGKTGFTVSPDDPAELLARLECLLHDPALRRELGRGGRARVEADFDARTNADRLIRLALSAARHVGRGRAPAASRTSQ